MLQSPHRDKSFEPMFESINAMTLAAGTSYTDIQEGTGCSSATIASTQSLVRHSIISRDCVTISSLKAQLRLILLIRLVWLREVWVQTWVQPPRRCSGHGYHRAHRPIAP